MSVDDPMLARVRVRCLARNPAIPADLLRRLLDEHLSEVKWPLVDRPVWTDEQVDVLVAHPDTEARRVLAQAINVSPGQRDRLVDDPDVSVRWALAEGPQTFRLWIEDPQPALTVQGYERLIERMPRFVLLFDDHPYMPRELRERLWPSRPDTGPEPLSRAEAEAMADDDENPHLRRRAAMHPDLPADLVARLATDPHHEVRLVVSMRPELSEEQRAAIDYQIDSADRLEPAAWAVRTPDPQVQRRCATSAHIGLRRSVALNRSLDPDLIATLAADPDFAVRLLLCETNAAVPADTVIATFLDAQTLTRGRLLEHPAIRRDSLAHLAGADDPHRRALTVLDPEVPADVIERLSHDPEPVVRQWIGYDGRLSPQRVLAMFDDPHTTGAAAANPRLPVALMRAILDAARPSS